MDIELKEILLSMQGEMRAMREDLAEVKQRVTKIEVTQEQVTNKNIQLLMEAHTGTREKLEKLDKVAEDVEEIKIKVSALESVTRDNTSEIKDIRLAK